MMQRPRPGEGEEDILKMQEEFLREKRQNKNLQAAAQVVDLRVQPGVSGAAAAGSKRGNDELVKTPSKYAQAKGLTKHNDKRARIEKASGSLMGEIIEKNVEPGQSSKEVSNIDDDQVYFPKVIPLILGNIVEKNLPESSINLSGPGVPTTSGKGFPTAKKRNPGIVSGARSIFSQQIELEKAMKNKKQDEKSDAMEVDFQPVAETQIDSSPLNIPSKSFIVTSEDADSIHKQNVEILSKMSEKEILQEQQKLLAGLDPEVIKYIKICRRAPPSLPKMDTSEASLKPDEPPAPQTEQSSKDSSLVEDMSHASDVDALLDNDILSHPHIDSWLNFNSLEKDKLEWMKGIEESKRQTGDEPYEARFNLKGYLLPYSIEYNEDTKTLFHHGEEPHRPGYTLLELFALARSSVIQQRAMALNVIAGILEYYSVGIYQGVIEIPITKIFFVIRIAMDENTVSVLEPTLRAMRNLLYNRMDEACLDALISLEGCTQPCLEHDKSEAIEIDSEESELKDFHLADIDLIAGAVRTDILQRIQYILSVVKPSFNCVQYCLQILTRIARDSVDLATKIVKSDLLMNCIVTNFLPVTGVNFHFNASNVYNGKPILAALKLIRVLALQSHDTAEILVTNYKITESICAYINSGVDGTYGLRIQMEALSTLTNLLINGAAVEQAISITPVLTTSFYKHVSAIETYVQGSELTVTHAAILLRLISKILIIKPEKQVFDFKYRVYPLIKQCFTKCINQLCVLTNFTCGSLRLACAAFDCMSSLIEYDGVEMALGFMGQYGAMGLLSRSSGLQVILQQLIPSSNLLSSIDSNMLHSTKNLTNLGCSIVGGKHEVLPLLGFASPIPVLASVVRFLDYFKDTETSIHFANQMQFYLSAVGANVPKLCENWFTRTEMNFLFYLLKISSAKTNLTESEKDLIYAVANKICYIFRSDKMKELDYIFKNIVFNKEWFTVERLMSLVSLTDSNIFTKTLTSIDEIRQCYSQIINFNCQDEGPSIILRTWQEPILPRDWIYLPIVKLYTDHQSLEDTPNVRGTVAGKVEALKSADKEFIVSRCLEWILFNELSHNNLVTDINITDRFCRIMCVYLCDNSLFLEPNIKMLLEKCIETIFRKEKEHRFNFDKDLTGLHNFQDFYTQFLEQFQAVSYGDPTFAACVLVPLAQRHNLKWRKLVWSEYAGCLRALDCPEEKLCYNLNEYLYPDETDESLIKSYIQALSTNLLRPSTISHKIAEHHVLSFRKSKFKLPSK